MSVTDPSTVITPGGFTIIGAGADEPQVFTLYTLSGIYNERVESVYMTVPWGSNEHTNNVLVVQLVAPNGDILYEQATPPQLGVDDAPLESHLTWSRLGNDTAQLASAATLFENDDVRRSWCNMRLPDLVLAPLSIVNLLVYIDNGNESGDFTVSDASVTTTRNTGAVSTTSQVDINALLVPTTTG